MDGGGGGVCGEVGLAVQAASDSPLRGAAPRDSHSLAATVDTRRDTARGAPAHNKSRRNLRNPKDATSVLRVSSSKGAGLRGMLLSGSPSFLARRKGW
ncbi:hypothetical protein E2C01_011889 [Portunus trituberculatus]|uniref:Uncharacterized protein n=1 Tax=Portunus trituberculatus TaxID=210409 RepID=A0A5B7DCN7_PORTR|nr:hypothetical protein [Portunus trituberculatus]